MKNIFLVVLIIILAIAAFFIFSGPDQEEESNSVSAEGVVAEVNLEGVALDGPALVYLRTANGTSTIAVPSMGINLCAARNNIADVFALKAGQRVSVMGEQDEEGRIVPCEDSSHYLRVN